MTNLILHNVSLSYPIYASTSRSLKRDIIGALTMKRTRHHHQAITCVNALRNISFELNKGDYLGLIGHNGAGKSTLLRVLSGIYEVNQGNIHVNGSIASLLGGSVGMQPELTGYENIRLNSIINGFSKEQASAVMQDVVAFTELGDFLSLPVKMYSSGMQARLAFGISTAIQPDILLLDEMVGTGDAKFIHKAKDRMNNLLTKANILVLASHATDILRQFCNKLLWLDQGEIKALGPVDEVLRQYDESVKAEQ